MNNHVRYPAAPIDSSRLIINIDKSTENVTYFGWATPGSSESSSVWKIWKATVSSGITSFRKADGNDLFDNQWSNRASLTYL